MSAMLRSIHGCVDLDGLTVYEPAVLTQLARAEVKGKGRYKGWDLRIGNGTVQLCVYYDTKDARGFTLHSLSVAI